MKQAILITAYKNFEHLIDLASYFDASFVVCIHVDKKSPIPVSILNQLNIMPQVQLVSQKYKVHWGGINHLKCILHLAKEAFKYKDIERFHVISGHDYPIKTLDSFHSFFSGNPTNYLSHFSLPNSKWPNGGLDRIAYYNFYDLLNAKKYRPYILKLVHWQKKIGIKRGLSSKLPKLYGGETWWSLSRDAVAYVLSYTNDKPYFLRRLKHSFCSEEIYVQSVLMASPLADTIVNNSLRFIDWSRRNGNFPANLDGNDLDNITKSSAFFARKFEFPVSESLKLQLIKQLKTY